MQRSEIGTLLCSDVEKAFHAIRCLELIQQLQLIGLDLSVSWKKNSFLARGDMQIQLLMTFLSSHYLNFEVHLSGFILFYQRGLVASNENPDLTALIVGKKLQLYLSKNGLHFNHSLDGKSKDIHHLHFDDKKLCVHLKNFLPVG